MISVHHWLTPLGTIEYRLYLEGLIVVIRESGLTIIVLELPVELEVEPIYILTTLLRCDRKFAFSAIQNKNKQR